MNLTNRRRRRIMMFAIALVLRLLTCLTPIAAAAAGKGKYLVYIGTYTDHGGKGIYPYRFDAKTGTLSPTGAATETENPSFLTVDSSGRFLYAVNELETYQGQPTGAVSAFSIDSATGKLSLLNQVSSHDPGPAHIALDRTGKFALVSHYTLGSLAVFPISNEGRVAELSSLVRHHGVGVDPQWQKGPHVHEAVMSPDNRFALVNDLGIDQVAVYPFEAGKGTLGADPMITHTRPGFGPRHLVFSPDGKLVYVVGELLSSVATYSFDAASGELKEAGIISALPHDFSGISYAAEIMMHPSGKFLYVSNRGYDSIAVFSTNSKTGVPTLLEIVPTGKRPRYIGVDPTGSWLLSVNQDSNNVLIFKINRKTGRLSATGQSVSLPAPVCMVFVPAK
jgi:6-phosphogluconolactonase